MKVIKKLNTDIIDNFSWINFDSLPDSDGFKFEIYYNSDDDIISQSIKVFHTIFKSFLNEVVIGNFPQGKWGDFCLDTWDLENNKYDYSPQNKEEPTASYLAMLNDNKIEPEYEGYCECIDWNKFLYVTLNCVMRHTAPYSMMFYVPNQKFVFYFHHTGSFGLYYKELNEGIKDILSKIRQEKLVIKNANDSKIEMI